MIQHVTHLYGLNLGFARALVRDVAPEQMVAQPHGVVNHPAWTLGHLTMAADSLAACLGLERQAPAGWDRTFATGGTPSGELAAYPSQAELLAALTTQHERNTAAARQADPALFGRPHPDEKRRERFPTIGDIAIFLMTSHEMDHLGQLAAWRRAMGLGPAGRA